MLLVSRVENADMFALYFLGKPSSIYDKDNPDWAPSQKLGYDCNKVKESSQERYNRAQERVEKRRRSEGAIALMELSKTAMEETMDAGVTVEELNCKACQTDITSEYFTELIQNEETLKKENAALKEQQQTFSSYKHHNTVKYLIGITPQGTVSFISEGWGGRVSDKHLTENSGLLDHLTPGDVILADRGFDIQESVGLFCSTIKIPAFTKGKKQLSGIEVEQTRRIANVRIHVERVIGNIRKKYSILGATQPIDFVTVRNGDVTTLDKIVTICCTLVNICDSVVPFE